MKSSIPVFTRQNPFQSVSRGGKTHYHPSGSQCLTKKKKKTALSPERLNQRSTPQTHTLSSESQLPLERRDNRCATKDGQPVYAESWPSTDCGSSPASSVTSSDTETPKQSTRAGKSKVSFDMEDQEDSVLAKYIERFRHGRPQSREERQLMTSAIGEEELPFWWMSPSSLPSSSTPTKTTDKDVIHPLNDDHAHDVFSAAVQRQSDRPLSPCRGSLSVFLDTSQAEFEDTEILHLQEKASRLLLKGECTLSDGSIPVSSEGLGFSDFSSPVSVDEPVQRPLIPSLLTTTVKVSSDSQKSVIPSLVTPTRPEEDILFQWRLRRKMEQAREWPQSIRHSSLQGSTLSWQAPSLSYPTASRQVYKQQQSTQPPEFSQKATHNTEAKEAHGACPVTSSPPPFHSVVVSGSSISQTQAIAHVPAHMHLLCDVLPCPVKSTHASAQQSISLTSNESQAKVVHKKTKVPGNTNEEPSFKHASSSPPVSSGTVEEEKPSHHKKQERTRKEKAQTEELEKIEKKTGASTRKQKKLTRYSADGELSDGHSSTNSCSHQRLPKKVKPSRGHRPQQGAQESPSESYTCDHAPPPSPVHSALGQVVSEVLFPTVDSSPAQKTSVSLVSPHSTAPAPHSTVPPCSAQNSVEVISQLLQEAEDSDEKEFEEDHLLQVLRKQRKWVKEQISEVDSMLNEFLGEKQVT
ncbi:proline and serine-rich protein 3 [Anabas testudineus]|uniref:Proline and serine rich 3 n=1 Tax=Anabas testudineus TaxID=64144 RepID=A0A3Q1HYZ7_ANATE|nr:proline and serine-rich protein 3 [Anabas testudineus]